eukprot:3349462-Amphidinium_carterae.1
MLATKRAACLNLHDNCCQPNHSTLSEHERISSAAARIENTQMRTSNKSPGNHRGNHHKSVANTRSGQPVKAQRKFGAHR